EQVTGRQLAICHLPPAPGDMAVTQADTGRLQQMVGFLPSTPLAEGLDRQYRWIERGGEP
ncbi:MAG TPA: hypothetical protein VD902_03290, partial [Symbiobacteriaceae bacterium]|nr:hypothetical protein [Symbiobacteriaceae bacterium]